MKSIKIFGKKIILKIEDVKEKDKKSDEALSKKSFDGRMAFLILILILSGIIGKFNWFQKLYQVGDIAKQDIVSNMVMSYKDEKRKEEIIKNIIKTSQKIYKRDDSVEPATVSKMEGYFELFDNLPKKMTVNEKKSIIKESGIKISTVEFDYLAKMSFVEKEAFKARIITIVKAILARGVIDDEDIKLKIFEDISSTIIPIEKKLISEFITPNEYYDEKATQENRREKIEELGDVIVRINPGETIIKKGQEITEDDISKLKLLGLYSPYYNIQVVIGYLIYFMVVAVLFYILAGRYLKDEMMRNKIFYSTMIIVVMVMIFSKVFPVKYIYIFPFGMMVLLVGILSTEKHTAILSSTVLMFLFANSGFDFTFLLLGFVDMAVGIYYVKKIKNRNDIVNAGSLIGMIKVILIMSLSILMKKELEESVWNMMYVFLSGMLSGMITVALLLYFENTFNILTNIKLIELSDFSNPLLKELMIKAPGTFHHSIMVSTLAERAAEAVGANPLFARVATYYHDIGKMKKPNFYVENQFAGVNPHENLNPYLSSLVITSHTKDGEEMAKRYRIPKEIRDVMKEHQGTTLLAYFYNKAKKENPDVNEMDFRYEGPKPKTKESAIIMLADSVEASVRSIPEKDRNSLVIEEMVRKVVNHKVEDEQLSDAELTFKDIETIIQTFLKVIQGIYHVRIKYPDMKKK